MKWFLPVLSCLSVVVIALTGCQTVQLESPTESDAEWIFDWDNLESRIIELTNQALREESLSDLYQLKSQLVSIHTGDNDQRASSRDYWTAILNSNLILVEQEHGENTQVHRLIDESIELLERTDYAIVETNALLAMLYRAKIDHDRSRTFELFSKMQDALDVAIEEDPTNLRVLLAQMFISVAPILGFSIDLDVQASIDTALTSTYEVTGDAMTPTWGLPEIYALAIGRLMEAEKLSEANELAAQAISKFPNDYLLSFYASLFQVEPENVDP